MAISNFLFDPINEPAGSILAAKAERQTKSERQRHDHTREKSVDELDRHVELGQRSQDGKDPDWPPSHGAEEIGGLHVGSSSRASNKSLHRISNHYRQEQDKHRNNHPRQVHKHDFLEESVDLGQTKDIKRGDQEDYDDKPFDKVADEYAGVKSETGSIDHRLKPGTAKGGVEFDGTDNLGNDLAEKRRNEPADNKNHYCDNEVRDEIGHSKPDVLEWLTKNIAPCF